MNEIIHEHTLRSLTLQRNIFLMFCLLLLCLALILSSLLFMKSERIIVTPPIIEKEFWVDGVSVSPSYLEQMACFIGDLLLTRSPQSSDFQLSCLLRQTEPAFANMLTHKLSEELTKMKKDNSSYVFFRSQIFLDPQKCSVKLVGERVLFIGDKVLSKSQESYRLGFVNFGGRLLLASVEKEEKSL